jgi:hypothetical protein
MVDPSQALQHVVSNICFWLFQIIDQLGARNHFYPFLIISPDRFISKHWQELDEINHFGFKSESVKTSDINILRWIQDISGGYIMGFDK